MKELFEPKPRWTGAPPPTARDRVLAQTGRPAPARDTAKSAAQIMADMALMKRLRQEAGI